MVPEEGLGAVFLAHLDGGAGDRAPPEGLDGTLAGLCDTARAAWPGLAVDGPAFVRHLAARVAPRADLGPALAEVHAADLYLACACAHDVAGALRRFEERYAEAISRPLRRLDRSSAFSDEVRQQVRQKLFMSEGGAPPRIAAYAGRGPLAGWLGILAHRTGLNVLRTWKAQAETAEHADTLAASGDPELDAVRLAEQRQLRAAFQAAVTRLTPHERMILLLCFVKGLSHDKIAGFYSVHQTTITRQIAGARQTLAEGIERYYREQLKMSAPELAAAALLMGSQLDLSLSRWLGEEAG